MLKNLLFQISFKMGMVMQARHWLDKNSVCVCAWGGGGGMRGYNCKIGGNWNYFFYYFSNVRIKI